jgi:hypothetical protein
MAGHRAFTRVFDALCPAMTLLRFVAKLLSKD